ncbi:MAG: inositol monophosphatase family protein [Candidatus Hydrogenedens sp.]
MNVQEYLELGITAVHRAGIILSDLFREPCEVIYEDDRDIKLLADRESESAIIDVLESTPFAILSEERGWVREYVMNEPFWIIDPLDGTLNFSRKIPLCAISIALMKDDEFLLGIVYDFLKQELFSGTKENGAFLNDSPIKVSPINQAKHGIVATGLPVFRPYTENEFQQYIHELKKYKRVRFLGTSALSLAYVACGRIDAFIQDEIMLWDIAGGSALIKFAGGTVKIYDIPGVSFAKKIRTACCEEVLKS